MKRPLHPDACAAAVAARLVEETSGVRAGDDFRAWMFGHQNDITRLRLRQELQERLDLGARFDANYTRLLGDVVRDVDLGIRLGVTGTPTQFIDGVKLRYPAERYIEAVIQHVRVQGPESPRH